MYPRYNLSRGITMDSVPRDLRDALAEDVDPAADRASAAVKLSARTTSNHVLVVRVPPSPWK
jgi:hypothetical protein